MNEKTLEIAKHIEEIIKLLGEDPSRQGLLKTPERAAKALQFLTEGYQSDPIKIINEAQFDCDIDNMVIVKDIEIYSLCEHHLLPFYGKCHVAYIPNKRVLGLSKIPRLVNTFTRRLQIQEALTSQIAESIQSVTEAKGVAVVIEAKHLCMMMRGVEKQNPVMTTSAMLGIFRDNARTRSEFLNLLSGR